MRRNNFQKRVSAISGVIIIVLIILGVIHFLIIPNFERYQTRAGLSARIEKLKKEIESLEKRNQELKAEISQAQEENYLEEVAREHLNLKKLGEEVVTILPEVK